MCAKGPDLCCWRLRHAWPSCYIERYDPERMVWEPIAPMSTARSGVSVVTLFGRIYAIGGYDGQNVLETVECYDCANDTWMPAPPMGQHRTGAAAVVYRERIMVAGGWDGYQAQGGCEQFNVLKNSWMPLAPLTIRRHGATMCIGAAGVYACGGWDGFKTRYCSVEKYNSEKDQWAEVEPMAVPRFMAAAVGI